MKKTLLSLFALLLVAACSDDAETQGGSLLSGGASSSSVSQSASSAPADTEKPIISLTAPGLDDTITVSPLLVRGTATDNSGSATVFVRLDSESWQTTTPDSNADWSVSLPLTVQGGHALYWYAKDAAGNCTTTNSLTFTFDTGAPSLAITAPANGSFTRQETVTLAGTASAPVTSTLSTVEAKLATGEYSAVASSDAWANWTWVSPSLTEGVHSLMVRASAANGKTAVKSISLTVDRTRPTASISAPASSLAGSISLTISANDALSGIDLVRILQDGVVVKTLGPTVPATTTVSISSPGTYSLGIAASDKAGNVSLTNTQSITIYAAPVIAITAPASGAKITTGSFAISGTASLTAGTITNVLYKFGSDSYSTIDDGGSGYATWSKTVTPVAYGSQNLTVRAYGNYGQYTTSSRSFIWDPVKPLAGFESPQDATSFEVDTSVVFTITNSDNPGGGVASLFIAINGANVKTWPSPSGSVTYSHLFSTLDMHSITTWAIDMAGNSSKTNEIIIETLAPLLGSASIEWAKGGSTDGGLTINYSVTRPATSYFVVVASGFPPSAQQVKDGLTYDNKTPIASFTTTSQTTMFEWVDGLYPGNSYSVYMVSDDGTVISSVRYAGSFTANATGTIPVFSDLIFTEYIEGNGFNKALEVFNGTGVPVLILSNYKIELYLYGGSGSSPIIINAGYGDVVSNGGCYVWTHNDAVQGMLDKANKTAGTLNFAGAHVILLRRLSDNAIVDSIGSFSEDGPWDGSGISTQNRTLRRKKSVTAGDTNSNDSFDPSNQWAGYPVDTYSGLGIWQE